MRAAISAPSMGAAPYSAKLAPRVDHVHDVKAEPVSLVGARRGSVAALVHEMVAGAKQAFPQERRGSARPGAPPAAVGARRAGGRTHTRSSHAQVRCL